jgi:sulfur carrier protein ThiS
MEVFIEKDKKTIEINDAKIATALDLLQKLNINESETILVRNGEVILAEEKLNKKDKIQILSVISGG